VEDVDTLLKLLENPTRRRILRRLTLETHYPLQLAKELKVSPQAIMKQLDILEKHGLVRCERSTSTMGPTRKCYYAARRISLRLDVAPHLFEARIREGIPEKRVKEKPMKEEPIELSDLYGRLKEINEAISTTEMHLGDLIREKEGELDRALKIIQNMFEEYEEREIMQYILTHRNFSLSELSRNLGLREEYIRGVLKRLQEMGLIPKEEE
jgi:predicted transcriptional regulator